VAVLALVTGSVSLAAQPRSVPEVEFFSTGLPELLSRLRTLVNTAEYCNSTPAAACRAGFVLPAPIVADMRYFLDRITTFETTNGSPTLEQQGRLDSPSEAPIEIAAQRSDYEIALREFDTQFLGHFGALLHVCGNALEGSDRSDLRYRDLRDVTFARYWNLSAQDSQRALGVVDSIGAETIRQLRDSPAEGCPKKLELGKKLLDAFARRSRPYAANRGSNVSSLDRWGESVFFTWSIALELEAQVRPEVLKEVAARVRKSQ
jgi:hypothetical protein